MKTFFFENFKCIFTGYMFVGSLFLLRMIYSRFNKSYSSEEAREYFKKVTKLLTIIITGALLLYAVFGFLNN